MSIVNQARVFAVAAHEAIGQVRKYTGEPYWHHCREVVQILLDHTTRDSFVNFSDMLAAAWLHDTVEDTKVTIDVIEHEFGRHIAALVSDLTDVSKPEDGKRAQRKEIDRQHTAMASAAAKTIKLADLISNTKSITAHDPDFARVYLREKQLLLGVLHEGDQGLYKIAAGQIHPLLAV